MTRDISPPNLLLIVTDQQRADHLGCYGNAVVRTPNLDRIAASGSLFEQFYVASTVCMPNRASIMTGLYPSVHGTRSNGIPLSRHVVTFPEVLRAEGYRTALVGKAHFQNMDDRPASMPAPETPHNNAIGTALGQRLSYERCYNAGCAIRPWYNALQQPPEGK